MATFKQITPWGEYWINDRDGVCQTVQKGIFWDTFLKDQVYDKYIQKHWVCIDAGAHWGYHSVYLAHKCKEIHCFEPQKYCYDYLLKNLELNNIKNAKTYNVALFNKKTKMLMNIYKYCYEQNQEFIYFPLEDTEFFKRYYDGVPIYNENKFIINKYLTAEIVHHKYSFIDG